MRTIKFRGKRKGKAEWVFGDLLTGLEGDCYIIITHEEGVTKFEVNPDSVGQFTGLYDKNGKEIYEGDIINFTKWDGKSVTGLVKWNDCNPCMCIEFKTEYKQTDWEYDFIKCGTMIIEVIGNIHDNPEFNLAQIP